LDPDTVTDTADRLALRELVDTYAQCVDRRDAAGLLALFTEDSYVATFREPGSTQPSEEFHGPAALIPVVDGLHSYDVTTHFVGQSIVSVDGDRASGETYSIVYHLSTVDDRRVMFTTSVRYLDAFVKQNSRWLFASRKLMFDWAETREMGRSSHVG
jgi:hypothetical protein